MKRAVVVQSGWLSRAEPLVDETFSSWMFRAAQANGLALGAFAEVHLTRQLGWRRDIDRFVPEELLNNLAVGMMSVPSKYSALTFRGWDELLGNRTTKSRSAGNAYWYVKANRPEKARKNPIAMQYCSTCLGEQVAYFRRSWRLSFVTHCTAHRSRLRSTCPQCESPFFYRATLFAAKKEQLALSLRHCLACGSDLCGAVEVSASSPRRSYELELALLRSLAASGIVVLPRMRATTESVLAFVRHLIELLWQNSRSFAFRSALLAMTGRPVDVPKNAGHIIYFDKADREIRASLMDAAGWFLEDWPARYREFRHLRRTQPAIIEATIGSIGQDFVMVEG